VWGDDELAIDIDNEDAEHMAHGVSSYIIH
jgi:hypothetical protein